MQASNNKDKRKIIWFIILPILAIAAFFLLSNALSYVVSVALIKVTHVLPNEFGKIAYLVDILSGIVLIIIFFVIYKLAFKNDSIKSKTKAGIMSGMNARINTRLNTGAKPGIIEAGMSIIAGIGVSGVSFLWVTLAERIPALKPSLDAMDKSNAEMGGGILGVIWIAVIIAPLLEELIFRGIVFRSLEKIKAGWITILISAVLFGAYHMNLVQAVYATFMGIVAAVIYAKTRNLVFPILVHMANNLIGAIESFIPSEAGVTALNIFAVVMIVPMFFAVRKILKKKSKYKLKTNID